MSLLVAVKLPESRIKIVDLAKGGTNGVFKNIQQALSEAENGDIIQIKHGESSREVVMPPVVLAPAISVTIKPFEGHHPILVLNPKFKNDKDLFLFQIQEGTLQFEDMGIRLDPVETGYEAQSIVQLAKGSCIFSRCVLDLKAIKDVQLNAATFLDLDQNKMMKMEPNATLPRVEFRDCFIRGKGDLVSVRGCRPLQVEVKRSLIALAGQLLDVQAANKMMPMDKTMISWRMDGSSVCLRPSRLSLWRSETSKGLAKTGSKMDGCLLASLMPDQPIAFVELNKNREESFDEYLVLEGKQTFYASFLKRDWTAAEYDKLVFPKLDDIKHTLWDATPNLFKPATPEQEQRIAGFGLTLTPEVEERLLPMPAKEDEN